MGASSTTSKPTIACAGRLAQQRQDPVPVEAARLRGAGRRHDRRVEAVDVHRDVDLVRQRVEHLPIHFSTGSASLRRKHRADVALADQLPFLAGQRAHAHLGDRHSVVEQRCMTHAWLSDEPSKLSRKSAWHRSAAHRPSGGVPARRAPAAPSPSAHRQADQEAARADHSFAASKTSQRRGRPVVSGPPPQRRDPDGLQVSASSSSSYNSRWVEASRIASGPRRAPGCRRSSVYGTAGSRRAPPRRVDLCW